MNLQKTIIFLALFLDIIGIAIIIPAFPELKLYYGISDFQVTMGLTIYSLCAFLAAPLLGQISDKFGRKKPLALCIFGTMLSYLVLLVTKQYRVFLLSRAINGITGGNVSILQAILTDISPDQETKSKNFGLMGAIFGLGFIIGPVVGSLLLRFGTIETIFWFGALFALIEGVLIITHFSNTNHPDIHKSLNYNSFTVILKYLRKPELRNFLLSLFLLGVGGFMINATMSLFMANQFGTSGESYGYILAFAGLISGVNMGLLIPKFWTKVFSQKSLIRILHIALIVGYSAVGFAQEEGIFLVLFYLTTLLGNIYMPIYNVVIMSKAKPNEIGEISGMMGGAQSLLMFVGPLLGGLLLARQLNIFRGSVVCFIMSIVIMLRYLTQTKQ